MNPEVILVVEDNDTMRLGIVESLRREGYLVSAFNNGPEALKNFQLFHFPIAVVDLKMEPMDGIEVLSCMKEIYPSVEVLIISAYGTVEAAVKAMQLGASDFLSKPFSPDELRIRISKIVQKIHDRNKIETLVEQNRLLNEELFTGYQDIIGNSEAIRNVFSLIEQVADRNTTVLISGESGTGKELAAHAIHHKSKRAECPFIKVNCGALNENLLESELFGHEKGAFTGAVKQKKGRFELADRGTLLLDEIGDISLPMQIKLLRVLQDGEFERVGGESTIKTDVRIIAASNQDLQKLISEGKFRADLYYRLSVIPIHLPSLRERKEDIPVLIEYFLNRFSAKANSPAKKIDPEGMKLLIDYPWPGNIRELENLIERLFVISTGDKIEAELIGRHLNRGISISAGFDNLQLEEALFAFEKILLFRQCKNQKE